MTKEPILSASDLVMDLGSGDGRVRAVKGVTLSLYPGELTLLMGPSGSGKTTLLSILGCMLVPSGGSLTIGGKEAQNLAPSRLASLRQKYIGFVFQSYNLFPALTVLDNVKVALDIRGDPERSAEQAARMVLSEVGLSHRLDAYPGTLSGGEKQRVAIARALAPAPAIILADEPTSALDMTNGQAVMHLLSSMAKVDGRTVLAVSHDERTIPFADRILWIDDGCIAAEERFRSPRSARKVRKPSRQGLHV